MVIFRVANQQRNCLPHGWGSQCRNKDNQQLRVGGIGRVNAVRYNLGQISGTSFCGRNIPAGANRWTVAGQLGFHCKAKRQQA